MKNYLMLIISLYIILAGCTNSDSGVNQEKNSELLEVSIDIPEKIPVDTEVVLSAVVTQGKDKVEDADEVKFEIRKVGEEDSEMIKATHQGKGTYEVKKTFKEDGKYVVTAHVTARSMHNMPSEKITVGNPAESDHETEYQHNESTEDHSHESGEATEGDHHHSTVTIDLDSDHHFKVNQKEVLSAQIKNENQPLTNAAVRFEIWYEGDPNHEFVEATEEPNGIYKNEKVFAKSGTYNIKVHVEKDEIHDHKEYKIKVQ